jgi:hypothetical protein
MYMVIFTLLIRVPTDSAAEWYDERRSVIDAIQITATHDQVVALNADGESRALTMKAGELVRSVQTFGEVGAVVTSDRMLAISSAAFEWHTLQLTAKEVAAEAYVSELLVLFITHERAVVFDGLLNRMITTALPIGENVIDQRVEQEAAVAVTLRRAVGYAAGSAEFHEQTFRAGEIFRAMTTSAGLISVDTSSRVLLFSASESTWSEQRPPFQDRW